MFDKSIVVLLAPGFEILEAMTPVDVFRRAGLNVVTAAVATNGSYAMYSSHKIPVQADCLLEELVTDDIGLVYLPGGMPGATNLAETEAVHSLVREVLQRDGWVAAICAAPIALEAAGLLNDMEYTCYPSFEKQIANGNYTGNRVEVCEHVLTACGPGASLEFAFTILKCLGMADEAEKIAKAMQMPASK